ncbi:MAG: hypothetical protein CMJ68_12315 [Planctomycetaceae bacterium]|nr:hypothetical protein [Planctomycetaceae bacterium]
MRLLKTIAGGIRHVGRLLRTGFQAVLLLIVLLCVLEVGVRLVESPVDPGGQSEVGSDLVRASWTSGQSLQRLVRRESVVGDRSVSIQTNSLGLRGAEPVVPKPVGVLRVVCLGDERVLAERVPYEQTFCHRLQESLQRRSARRVEVINAGIPGECPLLSLLRVRHELLALDADLWLLNFDMSDVADDYRQRPRLISDRNGRPLACPHPSLALGRLNAWQQLCSRFRLVAWSSRELGSLWTRTLVEPPASDPGSPQGQYAWLADTPPDWTMHIEQALQPISRLQKMCRGRLAVTVCPAPWQVARNETRHPDARARVGVPGDSVFNSDVPFQILGDFLRQHDIPVCDLSEGFRTASEGVQLFQPDRAMLSPAGHELVARLLAEKLTSPSMAWWSDPGTHGDVVPAGAQRPVDDQGGS